MMVVTRTPLRISFAGGASDLPSFYEQEYGAVLSTAINQYVYVTVKRHGAASCAITTSVPLTFRFARRVDGSTFALTR